MKYLERKQRNEYLLEMIEKKRCFSLKQITEIYDCSERTVKRMLSELRDEGHNVKYCKSLKRFVLRN